MNPLVRVGTDGHSLRGEDTLTVQADDQGEGDEGGEGVREVVVEGVVGVVSEEGRGGDDVAGGGGAGGREAVVEGLVVVCVAVGMGTDMAAGMAVGVAVTTVVMTVVLVSDTVAVAAREKLRHG